MNRFIDCSFVHVFQQFPGPIFRCEATLRSIKQAVKAEMSGKPLSRRCQKYCSKNRVLVTEKRRSLARIKLRFFGQLLPKFLFALGRLFGHGDARHHIQVSARSSGSGQSAAFDA